MSVFRRGIKQNDGALNAGQYQGGQPGAYQGPPQGNQQGGPPPNQAQGYQQGAGNPQWTPSPPKRSKKPLVIAAVVGVVVILIVAGVFASGILKPSGGGGAEETGTPDHQTLTASAYTPVASQNIPTSGGKLTVTAPGSPANGVNIDVPAGAAPCAIQFDVSYATANDLAGLPNGAGVASRVFKIDTSGTTDWNSYRTFEKLVEVTLPYDPALMHAGGLVRFYSYDPNAERLESVTTVDVNEGAHKITFATATFSTFLGIEILDAMFNPSNLSIDTGFRPKTDGWFIPNYGSALNPGGNCFGMVSFAKWYFAYQKEASVSGMNSKWRQGDVNQWRDDATAIQLASRAQTAETDIWKGLGNEQRGWNMTQTESGISMIHAMWITDQPQLMFITARYNNGSWANYAHAIMAYEFHDQRFEIYDPNAPNVDPGIALHQMPFNTTSGFSQVFLSGTTAANALAFNWFRHMTHRVVAPSELFAGLYQSAEAGFQGGSQFPTVKLTDSTTTPLGSTPTDTDDDGKRDTTANKATISGTITGGLKQVTSTLVLVADKKYEASVSAAGEFSIEVPLRTGESEIIILATDNSTFSNWAGWLKDTILCKAVPAALTVTLSWGQDQSDVDLHVLEFDANGSQGQHIYYSHESVGADHPYLDFDNTYGYGPEHYYATSEMTLDTAEGDQPLFGTYQIRVHYYADHDDDTETIQPITWQINVVYLAYKSPTTGEEIWIEQDFSGYLGYADGSTSAHNFNSGSAAYSDIMEVEYPEPDASAYTIPLPTYVFP